jgi:hypothetical protein
MIYGYCSSRFLFCMSLFLLFYWISRRTGGEVHMNAIEPERSVHKKHIISTRYIHHCTAGGNLNPFIRENKDTGVRPAQQEKVGEIGENIRKAGHWRPFFLRVLLSSISHIRWAWVSSALVYHGFSLSAAQNESYLFNDASFSLSLSLFLFIAFSFLYSAYYTYVCLERCRYLQNPVLGKW